MSGSRTSALAAALAALVALAGCTPDLCGRSSDCSTGRVCSSRGACVIPADAAVGDPPATAIDAAVTPIGDAPADAFDIFPDDPTDAPSDEGLAPDPEIDPREVAPDPGER